MRYAKNKTFDRKIEGLNYDCKMNASDQLKIDFFDDADRKARNNKVKKSVDEIMNQRNFLLNERRARLDILFENDINVLFGILGHVLVACFKDF